jgi:muramoyltetrapeptide carboxypeptidase
MRRPAALRSGDRLAVIAPASPFPREDFEAGLLELTRLGFDPVYDERVFARQRYVAGDAQTRAAAFLDAWQNPNIAGVIAARGGYGSVQILPLLDPTTIRATPKVFVGASDLTAVLAWLTARCGVVAVHGPMVAGQLSRGAEGYDEVTWTGALMRPAPLGEIASAALDPMVPGEASGPLYGGNLTQLAASLGTPYAFDPPEPYVLFLEDVSERPYRVDRLLTQLRLAGVLGRARALVFGEMVQCDEPDGSLRCRDVVHEYVSGFPGPVVFGLPAGHTRGPALTLPLGVGVRVVSGRRCALVIEEAAVE